jgi:hypothetical protein
MPQRNFLAFRQSVHLFGPPFAAFVWSNNCNKKCCITKGEEISRERRYIKLEIPSWLAIDRGLVC